ANGFQCYLATGVIFVVSWKTGHFDPAIVYDHFGEILSSLNIIALVFCTFLLIKGHLAPSGADSGSCGSPLYDFYWGMELYPRIGSFDIKEFTNCRFGMMAWEFIILCFLVKQQQMNGVAADSMIVSVFLMTVYNTKFFMWETGYWGSIDIMHDRAGYYICWGCLVWVPSIYTSPALYLVNNPVALGTPLAAAITVAGLFCIWSNYDCDRQRQTFRETGGKAPVWGKAPTYIVAKYTTSEGTKKSSLLLTSGWWGLARHFHYLPEIMSSFFWTMPGLFQHPLHYFYVFYLSILLADRAIRDDSRCLSKYGPFWQEYQSKVPYRILPYIF
ncbi:7-dehydrocholesterol reductase, partial [Cymbomonas tetramitiformis]